MKPVPHASTVNVLQVSGFEDMRLAEQVLALAGALSDAGEEVSTAGPTTGVLRSRFLRQGLPLTPLRWNPSAPAPEEIVSRVARLLSNGRFSLVHAHDLQAIRLVLAALGQMKQEQRLPVIAHLHRLPEGLSRLARWREARRLRALLSPCAALLVSSTADRLRLETLLGVVAPAPEIVNPILPNHKRLSSAEAGFIRRRLGVSGHAAVVGLSSSFLGGEAETFFPAARRVLDTLANVEFVVFGEGPQLAASQELVHDLGLGGATVFATPTRGLSELLSVFNVLVVLGEGPGIYLDALQALQFEVPLVAQPHPALSELLPLFPQAQLLQTPTESTLEQALSQALHSVPAVSGASPHADAALLASLRQFAGSDQVWDLDKLWEPAPAPTNTAVQILALREYSPEAVLPHLLAVYLRVLGAE